MVADIDTGRLYSKHTGEKVMVLESNRGYRIYWENNGELLDADFGPRGGIYGRRDCMKIVGKLHIKV